MESEDGFLDFMDRSPNVASAGRHTGSISVARGQGVRSDCTEATAALRPGYILSPHVRRIILRMIQIRVTRGTATAMETVLPIFPFRVGTNNVPTLVSLWIL